MMGDLVRGMPGGVCSGFVTRPFSPTTTRKTKRPSHNTEEHRIDKDIKSIDTNYINFNYAISVMAIIRVIAIRSNTTEIGRQHHVISVYAFYIHQCKR